MIMPMRKVCQKVLKLLSYIIILVHEIFKSINYSLFTIILCTQQKKLYCTVFIIYACLNFRRFVNVSSDKRTSYMVKLHNSAEQEEEIFS